MKMNKTVLLLSFMTIPLLTGCSSLFANKEQPPKIEIVNRYVPVEIYHPQSPRSVDLLDVQFFVITEDNIKEKLSEIEQLQGNKPVVFAMTPQDYENMAHNLQELNRYIREQQLIVLYYRDATRINED